MGVLPIQRPVVAPQVQGRPLPVGPFHVELVAVTAHPAVDGPVGIHSGQACLEDRQDIVSKPAAR